MGPRGGEEHVPHRRQSKAYFFFPKMFWVPLVCIFFCKGVCLGSVCFFEQSFFSKNVLGSVCLHFLLQRRLSVWVPFVFRSKVFFFFSKNVLGSVCLHFLLQRRLFGFRLFFGAKFFFFFFQKCFGFRQFAIFFCKRCLFA